MIKIEDEEMLEDDDDEVIVDEEPASLDQVKPFAGQDLQMRMLDAKNVVSRTVQQFAPPPKTTTADAVSSEPDPTFYSH